MEPAPPGVRLELRLGAAAPTAPLPEGVRYAARFETPERTWTGAATVALESGQVEVQTEGELPPWVVDLTRAVLRAEWRKRPAAWPRRITRWRAAPEAR